MSISELEALFNKEDSKLRELKSVLDIALQTKNEKKQSFDKIVGEYNKLNEKKLEKLLEKDKLFKFIDKVFNLLDSTGLLLSFILAIFNMVAVCAISVLIFNFFLLHNIVIVEPIKSVLVISTALLGACSVAFTFLLVNKYSEKMLKKFYDYLAKRIEKTPKYKALALEYDKIFSQFNSKERELDIAKQEKETAIQDYN